MTTHAILSPSGSERWTNCPGAPNLEKKCPPGKTTIYAFEGTIAHALAEPVLKKKSVLKIDEKLKFKLRMKVLKESRLKGKALEELAYMAWKIRIDDEMLMHVNAYVDEIQKHIPSLDKPQSTSLYVEKKVKFYKTFGTVDCILVRDDVLSIYDLKYGKKKVKAKNNTQLAIYALGALEHFKNVNTVSMNIFQPRISKPLSNWTMSVKKFKNVWEPRLKAAMDNTIKDKHILNAGDWCYWCRAWRVCPEKKNKNQERARKEFCE